MILFSLTLSGWRCFLEEISVGPFSHKLNVISGPNGIGKSTLFEALRRALMDSYAVSGADINAIRPWGRAVAPKVTICFDHDNVQYRTTKQFLEGGFSRLERKEESVFRPLAEGRQADEYTRSLLSSSPPGRGLSQARNWGLAQVLWAPQGELKLADLSGDVVADIRAMLGFQVSGKSSNPVEQRITELYERYFTPQGKIKSGKAAPPIVGMTRTLEDARQRLNETTRMLQRCEEVSQQVEELGARHQQLTLDADLLDRDIQETRERADTYRKLSGESTNLQGRLKAIEDQCRQLQQLIELIRSLDRKLKENGQELARLKEDVPLREQERVMREKQVTAAKLALDDFRSKAENVLAASEHTAEFSRQYRDLQTQRAKLDEHIQKIEAAVHDLQEHTSAYAALVAPDRSTLKEIQKALQSRDQARLLLDAAMISLEIEPDRDGSVKVIEGENPGAIDIHAGKPTQIKGSPHVIIQLSGIARIRATGPAGDILAQRRAMRTADDTVNELTRPFGTVDIAYLEALTEKAERLERSKGEARKALEVLLGKDTLDSMKKEQTHLDAMLSGIEQEHPAWKSFPPDSEALRRIAEDLRRNHSQEEGRLRTELEKAETAFFAARELEQALINRIGEVWNTVQQDEALLAEQTCMRGLPDMEAELNRLLLDRNTARAALDAVTLKLGSFSDNPEASLEKQEKSRAALQDSLQTIRDRERTTLGVLEALTAQGPYSVYAQAQEEVARLENEIEGESLRMNAVKLLYEAVEQCRVEAMTSVAKPVEEAATRLLHRIAGRRIGRITVGDTLEPSAVSPELTDALVDLTNLSGGEQEQLYLATRIALAEVLASNGRHMVVLDDVLTATDTGRLARVLTLLEEAADRLQIIILTCHPERYWGLSEAEFFDLESLVRRS
ncbi:MAG TPA: AAA family ATPase [Thermodesulfobacteriota bacterium]|nr:AAA family ATPase [Thermodesulfobacteriota bacterium]